MSDPRVTFCQHRKKTESGKIRCIFPGRSYYFCKTNRRDNGAPCGFCWEMLFAYSQDCRTCRLRPFGSAPCLDDIPEYQECPGSDRCPNGNVCVSIAETEWPLAEIALKMAGVMKS